ncbi:unnamed protein product [Echinostoma caproni]|uniref:Ion_trans domain-containing protein n=1 Tax=Echinostoma caproni TaxID=27848 RepID=A0A183AJK5_9TREM|nr:unnamed protein product [Echinostoma caproni]
MKVLTTLLYEKRWIRITYIVCMLCISLANLVFSWLVYRDASLQVTGLVFDRTSDKLLAFLLTFNVIEIVFFVVDILAWTNTLWNEPDCWFIIDVANLFNILLSELPLSLINTYLSACHESAISEFLLVKSSMILGFTLIRFVALAVFYFMNSTDDGCVKMSDGSDIRLDAGPPHMSAVSARDSSDEETERCGKQNAAQTVHSSKVTTFCCDVVRVKRLRRFWLVVRVFILLGFFFLLLTNILIFKFTFVQTYKGYLEWRRILIGANHWDTVQNQMAERYFQDVEIFLKERELSTRKWLHLVSLEKLLRLQAVNASEEIGLNYIQSGTKNYCIFSQHVTYANRTTETSMTCWLLLSLDAFSETACSDVLENSRNLVRLKGLKIRFTYKPPDRRHHLGVLYYNATRTNIK